MKVFKRFSGMGICMLMLIVFSSATHRIIPNNLDTYFVKVDTISKLDMSGVALDSLESIQIVRQSPNQYFVLNLSDKSVNYKRLDGSMDQVRIEFMHANKWQILQEIDYTGIWCGNSYIDMQLDPKHYLSFTAVELPSDSAGVNYRLRAGIKLDAKWYYTAVWTDKIGVKYLQRETD
ncbi:MAG: hypothetical protein ACI9UJ_001542 [bacterium]|jgi:hypothetical protein